MTAKKRHTTFHIISMLICTIHMVLPAVLFSQTMPVYLYHDSAFVTCDTGTGKLNGSYISFYPNGIKKSEGTLQNGYRIGNWKVWDSTGRLRLERTYKTVLEYERLFPKPDTSGPIPLLINNNYSIKYNADGYIGVRQLKGEFAIWRHKYWRTLTPEGNSLLFESNRLFNIIKEALLSGNGTAYDNVDDRFTKPLPLPEITALLNQNNIITSYKLKEEAIFDAENLIFEYRILGICPQTIKNGKLTDLFWIYYPDFRKTFSKEKIMNAPLSCIKTLDDLFFYHEFSSRIIKTTLDNPGNIYLKDYKWPEPSHMYIYQKELELLLIESENDIWLSLSK